MKALAMLGLLALLDRDAVARLLKLSLTEQPKPEQQRAAVRLAAKLHGTMVARDERFSMALVDARTVFIGDELEGRTVRAIQKGCVLFDAEELCMVPRVAVASSNPAARHVSIANFAQWTQVRIVPAQNGGFKLFAIPKGSIYEELGIQNGDIVRTVNGKPVDFSAITLVKPGAFLKVELERNGQLYALEGQLD